MIDFTLKPLKSRVQKMRVFRQACTASLLEVSQLGRVDKAQGWYLGPRRRSHLLQQGAVD